MRSSLHIRAFRLLCAGIVAVAVPATTARAQSLKALSLEELGNIEVTVASKAPEEARLTPAAIFVITQDDIRRSGATSLPEVLRMAPGLDVGRIDSTHWSVGVRGFGDQFSKSVLVLIDGRSVYTPLFAGVFWAAQDTLIEDIERIEVIRGPGGTIWGSNAVNGVINVITKAASATTGTLASITAGSTDRAIASARYGASRDALSYRVYGKGLSRSAQHHSDGQEFDDWQMGQGGGRLDWSGGGHTVTVQGDGYSSHVGQSVSLATFTPPAQVLHYEPLELSGGNIMATWSRETNPTNRWQLTTYYDRTRLFGPQIGETKNTFDLDFNHRVQLGRNRISWGAGARSTGSNITQVVPTLDVAPHHLRSGIYGAFVEDSISLIPNRVSVTAGTKLEHYTYTGVEVQPSVRVLWTPSDRTSVWGAATRAVRTPSRLERDFSLSGFLGNAPVPTFIRVVGNPDFVSERLYAYEGGYRTGLSDLLLLDVSVFHNQHRDLESFGAATVKVEAVPPPVSAYFEVPYANGIRGASQGTEIALTAKPMPSWQLRGAYSYLHIDLKNQPGNTDTGSVETYEGSSPKHQVRLQSSIDLGDGVELDQVVRFVGALPARKVARYTAVDVRVGFRLSNPLHFSFSAQDLFDASHAEFGHDPGPIVEIRRSVLATLTWKP